MLKKSRLINLIGTIILGVVFLLAILVVMIARGALSAAPTKLSISSESLTWAYTGMPLQGTKWELMDGELREGHSLTVQVSGSQTNVGTSQNHIIAHIVDSNGVDVTEDYNIEYFPGTLEVLPQEITVVADSAQKIYDGTPLTAPTYQTLSGISLAEGETLYATVTGSITEIGEATNRISDVMITNAQGEDTSRNYSIFTQNGVLLVLDPNEEGGLGGIGGIGGVGGNGDFGDAFVVVSESAVFFYDGTTHQAPNYQILSGNLQEGDTAEIVVSGSQTEIGESFNTVTVDIYDAAGNWKNEEYQILTYPGTLTVVPPEFTIESNSNYKFYDGQPLQDGGYSINPDPSILGLTVTVEVTGSQTEVGESPNTIFDYRVYDLYGFDVTDTYVDSFTLIEGTLTVLDANMDWNDSMLMFMSGSSVSYYDGAEHVTHDYVMTNGALKAGHEAHVTYYSSQTEVGSTSNDFSVQILDEYGFDVTGEYSILTVPGTITVIQQPVAIVSNTAQKPYDGNPLTDQGFQTNGLLQGHRVVLSITGSQTEVGFSDNTVNEDSLRIYDEWNEDVTENYSPLFLEGKLTVTAASQSGAGGGGLDLGGGIGTGGEDPSDGPITVLYQLYSESYTGKVYLRAKNYGDYIGTSNNTWANAQAYPNLFENDLPANYLTSFALQNSGATLHDLKIIPTGTRNWVLAYYPTANGTIPTDDTQLIGTVTNEYEQTFYAGDALPNVTLPSYYATYEQNYSDFVENQYLQIDSETLAFLQQFSADHELDANDPDLIAKVAACIQGEATYKLDYTPLLDASDNQVIAFLDTYKEGICGHYATAATMLYRSLGVPARFTKGFVADVTAGETAEVTNLDGHAWVEVYLDGIGWQMVEVTGSDGTPGGGGPGGGGPGGGGPGGGGPGGGGSDGDEDEPPVGGNIKLRPKSLAQQYDGTPLWAEPYLAGDVQKILEHIGSGSYYEVTITDESGAIAQRTAAGKTKIKIQSVTFYDSDGTDVTDEVEEYFNISYDVGTLHVYYEELFFASDSYTKSYDGNPLTNSNADCRYVSGTLRAGDSYTLQAKGNITKVGYTSSNFEVTVYDAGGNNITDCYKINKSQAGRLTVLAREIVITAKSAEKVMDGTPLTCNEIEYDASLLANGDYIAEWNVIGSQTTMGRCDNVIDYVIIRNANGEDVTNCYTITTVAGTLKVTRT